MHDYHFKKKEGSPFDKYVLDNVVFGQTSKTPQIPFNMDRLSDVIGIRRAMYYLFGGSSGTGKTCLIDSKFILDPFDWWIELYDKQLTDIIPRWLYYSMERKASYKINKWVCFRLWKKYGILIDTVTMLGWKKSKGGLGTEIFKRIVECRDHFDRLLNNHLTLIDCSVSPYRIESDLKRYAETNGKIKYKQVLIDGIYKDVYDKFEETNSNVYSLVILDHLGKLSHIDGGERATINKASMFLAEARDKYNFSPVVISQFNRNLGSSQRMSLFKGDLSPQLEDFESSARTQHDADIVAALFDPARYKCWNSEGMYLNYPVQTEFYAPSGHNRFRSISILKNSYDLDGVQVGAKFMGECGEFTTLPNPFTDEKELNKILHEIKQGK